MKKTTGFTLIEVMVVLVIIGIMASMVVPQILGNQEEPVTALTCLNFIYYWPSLTNSPPLAVMNTMPIST